MLTWSIVVYSASIIFIAIPMLALYSHSTHTGSLYITFVQTRHFDISRRWALQVCAAWQPPSQHQRIYCVLLPREIKMQYQSLCVVHITEQNVLLPNVTMNIAFHIKSVKVLHDHPKLFYTSRCVPSGNEIIVQTLKTSQRLQ